MFCSQATGKERLSRQRQAKGAQITEVSLHRTIEAIRNTINSVYSNLHVSFMLGIYNAILKKNLRSFLTDPHSKQISQLMKDGLLLLESGTTVHLADVSLPAAPPAVFIVLDCR